VSDTDSTIEEATPESVETVEEAVVETMSMTAPEPYAGEDAPVPVDFNSREYDWGIACTECGRFIEDQEETRMVTTCGSCGASRTRCRRKDVKELVNQQRAKQGLSPLY
jgi:uncharacterized protein YkwD